ncbi:hypothetical protein NQ176_g2201 [Zarea fungicola]|uniref:Uncharacterized protein n=1 Tax=Zarea fungicola TaxID=93591 RepID=A0ACC1NPZ4_9HYPO|nr:hypothetical protein NQ176_g2201 [Lecanicillium fungicola]
MLRSSFLAVMAYASVAIAGLEPEGVNCNGSSNCQFISIKIDPKFGDAPNNQIPALKALIDTIDDNRLYNNGENIACLKGTVLLFPGAICTFLQKTSGGVLGRDIKTLMAALGNSCGACGSVATGFPGDLDVNHGMLTVNEVTSTKCSGVC